MCEHEGTEVPRRQAANTKTKRGYGTKRIAGTSREILI